MRKDETATRGSSIHPDQAILESMTTNPLPKYAGIAGFDIGTDDVATPNSIPDLTRSLCENSELVQDLCRYAENLASESAIRKKWRLSEDVWEQLGGSDELVRAVEEEKTRRIRSGATKREAAQLHIIRGPAVLATIMDDPRQSARHRVDSIKTLNAIADPGPEAAAEQQVFIRIDLSRDSGDPKDVLTFEATARQSKRCAMTQLRNS